MKEKLRKMEWNTEGAASLKREKSEGIPRAGNYIKCGHVEETDRLRERFTEGTFPEYKELSFDTISLDNSYFQVLRSQMSRVQAPSFQ